MVSEIDLIKQLRERTNAPLKDCKECLVEAQWDLERAEELLKEKWALQLAKKADRETNEWVVRIKWFEDWKFVWIKILCETDFVAKNQFFQDIVESALNILHDEVSECENIEKLPTEVSEKIDTLIKDNLVKLGEKIKVADVIVKTWAAFAYNHPGDKISAAIFYKWENPEIQTVAKQICMQIAAMNPEFLSLEQIDSTRLNLIKDELMEDLKDSWKPADIVEKIMQWRLDKALSEFVLLEQPSIRDDSKKVKDIIPNWMEVVSYVRLSI